LCKSRFLFALTVNYEIVFLSNSFLTALGVPFGYSFISIWSPPFEPGFEIYITVFDRDISSRFYFCCWNCSIISCREI